jgi:hypothetical protein
MRTLFCLVSASAVGLLSCGQTVPQGSAVPGAASPASVPEVSKALAPTRPVFENPGGMWMPHQMKDHAAKLKELGLAIDPAELSDPTSGLLSAIVSLGGCSASFISPDGLIATNHHCATGALQHNSSPSANLLKDGFLARTRAEEKNNGPQARVFVTRAVTDVTNKMRDGLAAISDDRARFKEVERRQKDLVAACERGRPKLRCSVSPYYETAQWFLTEQLEIRDVRLVWAPPSGVGNFGGEIDNWRWPRHTGDVTLFRAYVGKDGEPADASAENVPYKPPHYLKIASNPLREGDLVFVAGYPGRTNTLKTKAEVDEALSWRYPRRQQLLEDYLARLDSATKDNPEAKIRATSYVRRFGNQLTNTKGQIEGLAKGGLAARKDAAEGELRRFIASDPSRETRWGKALDAIASEIQRGEAHRERDAQLEELSYPRLVGAAMTLVRMAEERAKPDAEREPDFQERNFARIEQGLKGLSTSYHRVVDEAVMGLALERIARAPAASRTPAFEAIVGRTSAATPAEIAKAVSALYQGTKLGDERTRVELFKKATVASLRASRDPMIVLALKLLPLQKEAEEREQRFSGKMLLLKPAYMEALQAFKAEPFSPDANGTLRITYGTVRGYRPTPEAPVYRPFTVLSEVIGKDRKAEPFDVPPSLVAAYTEKRFGPYVDERLGEVPVDFLADLHITGGNSGSATLNAKGELTGLVFDGNYESMASDWLFVPSITRSIHVDIRYIAWLLDGPFAADHLLTEMGLKPKL